MKRLLMAEIFDDYRRNVIPADAKAVQITECKRAFYAGAVAVIGLMDKIADSPNEAREAESLWKEITDFGKNPR